jgi:hypothetical protein
MASGYNDETKKFRDNIDSDAAKWIQGAISVMYSTASPNVATTEAGPQPLEDCSKLHTGPYEYREDDKSYHLKSESVLGDVLGGI